jgi:hypothetical protein
LTAVGVVVLAAYNVLYVPPFNIGRWYFPVSMLFGSLVLIDAASVIPLPTNLAWLRSPFARALALGTVSACVLSLYVSYRSPGSGGKAAQFYYEEAPRIAAAYAGSIPPLVELDDGIVAFATGAKSLSGWGLVLDREAAAIVRSSGKHRNKRRARGLMDLAIERGYVRCATLNYGGRKLARGSKDKAIRQTYRVLLGKFAKTHRFEVEYLSADKRFSIVVGKPKSKLTN